MSTIANFTDRFGQDVEIDKLNNGKYCITVAGRMTQKDLDADGVIGWLANASHTHIPESLDVKVGESYFTKGGSVVKITETISESDEPLSFAAGYRFRSESGRNYTGSGDHNKESLSLLRKVRTE